MNAAQKAGTGRKHPGTLDHSGHKQTDFLWPTTKKVCQNARLLVYAQIPGFH